MSVRFISIPRERTEFQILSRIVNEHHPGTTTPAEQRIIDIGRKWPIELRRTRFQISFFIAEL